MALSIAIGNKAVITRTKIGGGFLTLAIKKMVESIRNHKLHQSHRDFRSPFTDKKESSMTELKRTKSINRDRFRKRRPLLKLAPLALAVMTLTACGGNEPNENLTIYESPEACFEANPNMGQECYNAYEIGRASCRERV